MSRLGTVMGGALLTGFLALGCRQAADAPGTPNDTAGRKEGGAMSESSLVMREDFSDGMDNWWVEGTERTWVEEGRLHVKADPPKGGKYGVGTVWYKHPLPANVRIEFDARVISSSGNHNNINLFFCYSMPDGRDLYATREERADAAYDKYKELSGYIMTFLNDALGESKTAPDEGQKARFRLRRCPGFNLVNENYAYHCRQGQTYHVVIVKGGGQLACSVDGVEYLSWDDPQPLTGGWLGLRTYCTYLWWDNVIATKLEDER